MSSIPPLSLDDLNSEQRSAVTHEGGPLLIVAGAGTGKTTVITRRIAWLILEQSVPTNGILALTFTEKAATEMEERVDRLLPYGYVDLWVSTFHSFCQKLLQRHGIDIGLPNEFRLLDPTATWMLLRRNMDRLGIEYYRPRGNPTKFLHALLQHFSRCKDEAVTPADYLAYAKELRLNTDRTMMDGLDDAARIEELANAFQVYQQLLHEEGALDFGDLLVFALDLLRTRPAIRRQYQEQFRHVLVDEFQDTNWTQYEIVKLLAPCDTPTTNLTVVGDDDQSIYQWRGASMSNILHFKKDYPTAREIAITTNYRATQNLLDASYQLIQKNNPNRLESTLGLNKRLRAAREGTGAIELFHAADAREETQYVIAKMQEMKSLRSEATWNDVAILVRANSQADQFLPALQAADIPYQFVASRGLYRKPIVLDILAFLALLDDYHESTACYRVCNIPIFGFSYDELLLLTSWASRKSRSLFQVLSDVRTVSEIAPETAMKADRIVALVQRYSERARHVAAREVVLGFLEDSGYLAAISDEESAEDHEAVGYLNQFWKRIEQYEASVDHPTMRGFVEQLELERDAGESGSLSMDPNTGPEAVKVLTVHAAKGLEFRYVFVVNCIEQRFPAVNRKDPIELSSALAKEIMPQGDLHIEEERRLFYVACTRARDGLFCSYADEYGGTRTRKASRFLGELNVPENGERGGKNEKKSHVSFAVRSPVLSSSIPLPIHHLPAKLSFTQLMAYRTCPWQYHYAHVLRIPLRGRWTLSFGQTMHLTLQRFFERVREHTDAAQGELFSSHADDRTPKLAPPSLDELLAIYREAWIEDWYQSRKQHDEYVANGKRMLTEFHARHEREGWPTVHAVEQPFTVKFGETSVAGKVDRMDRTDGGVEIIDYKTGTPKETLEADDKLQLLIYQVAATQALGVTPKMLSYYYLENNRKISFLGTAEELETVSATVQDIHARIAAGEFGATPGRQCRFCDFKNICPYAQG